MSSSKELWRPRCLSRGGLVVVALVMAASSLNTSAGAPRKQPDLSNCGGNDLAAYVGKPVADLKRLQPKYARFLCKENCVGTADVQPARLTVIYSEKTGRVLRMSCG